jgi:hypothetical protein
MAGTLALVRSFVRMASPHLRYPYPMMIMRVTRRRRRRK